MKWVDLKNYLAPIFIREIDETSELYLNLIVDIHRNNNQEQVKEYFDLRESINERIDEIDQYYEQNFDKPYIKYFHKGKMRLKKLLMFQPELIGHIDLDKDFKGIVFGINPKTTERIDKDSIEPELNECMPVNKYHLNEMTNNSVDASSNKFKAKAVSSKYNPPKYSLKSNSNSNNTNERGKAMMNMNMSLKLKKNSNHESTSLNKNNKSELSIARNDINTNTEITHKSSSVIKASDSQSIKYKSLGKNSKRSLRAIRKSIEDEVEDCYNNEDDIDDNEYIDIKDIIMNNNKNKNKIKIKAQDKHIVLKAYAVNKLNITEMSKDSKSFTQENKNAFNKLNRYREIETKSHNDEVNLLASLRKEEKEIVLRFQLTDEEYRYFLQEKAKMVLK